MDASLSAKLFLAILLILLNGFFVAAEFSIVKARLSQLQIKANEGVQKAQHLIKIIEHLDDYLSATQLGVTFASLALGWVAESSFYILFDYIFKLLHIEVWLAPVTLHSIAIIISFFLITCLHIIFGELIPKSLAIRDTERVAFFVAMPLILFHKLFRPFIVLMNGISSLFLNKVLRVSVISNTENRTTEELKLLIKQSVEYGEIEQDNYEIIKNALEFDDHSVKQTMIPRQNMQSIDILDPEDEIFEQILNFEYSRIPVYEESIDNILGVFHTKEVLREYIKNNAKINKKMLYALVHDVPYVVESKKISDTLSLLREKKQMVAIVINEFGGTEGIITVEDILEELVGDINDEKDQTQEIFIKIAENLFNVVATENIDDLNDFLPEKIELNAENYNTLAGFILHNIDELPKEQDAFDIGNYHIKILKMQNKSIDLVQLRYTPPKNNEEGTDNLVDNKDSD